MTNQTAAFHFTYKEMITIEAALRTYKRDREVHAAHCIAADDEDGAAFFDRQCDFAATLLDEIAAQRCNTSERAA